MQENLLTIVIPTYNRPVELKRLLEFQRCFSEQLCIIVLDGSVDELSQQNQLTCENFSNVEHHKFPSSLHLGLRLAEGLKLVKTPYVAFCGDDDFIFPASALECVGFLQSNQDYSAAIGQVWAMRYFPERRILRQGMALGQDLDFGGRFDHERFIQRSFFYFAYTFIGSIPLFYAVRRTEQATRAFSCVTSDLKYSSMELLTNCKLLIDGKVAKLPIPFGIRDYASITTRDPEREGESVYIPREDIEYMRPLLVSALEQAEGLSRGAAEYAIDSLLTLWTADVKEAAVKVESRVLVRIRLLFIYTQCLLGRVFPGTAARILGLPAEIYTTLLQVHQRFTAIRS